MRRPQTLGSFPLSVFSLHKNGGSHGTRERSHGAAAGPLAGARAPLCGSTPPSSGLAVVPFRSPRVEKQPESTSGASDLCRRAGLLLSSRAVGDRRWSLWLNPDVAKLTAEEWYFFSFRDRKYATGSRTNRATKTGYWKATGKDRVVHEQGTRALVGMRKTLVFYRGRAPNGQKTGWVMHEFRLETPNSTPKEDWVLCRVFNKMKPSSEGEEAGGQIHRYPATATGAEPSSPLAFLGSLPDPMVTHPADEFYQQRQAITTGTQCGSGVGSSGAMLMNLQAMLQLGSFLDYCSPVVHHGVEVGAPHNAGCCGDDAAMAMALGHVGFEEHGMGEVVEMEYAQAQAGCGNRGGLYC